MIKFVSSEEDDEARAAAAAALMDECSMRVDALWAVPATRRCTGPAARPGCTVRDVRPMLAFRRAQAVGAGQVVEVNRAPVMALWAAVVAERLGPMHDEALTHGVPSPT